MQAIETLEICGDEIYAIRDEAGKGWVVVKRVCEVLGLAYPRQTEKLKAAAWATVTTKVTVAEDGKNRELFCLFVDDVPMWLTHIDSGRVKPASRPKIVRYQKEARDVLRDWAYGRRSSGNDMSSFHAAMDRIERILEPLSIAAVSTQAELRQVAEKVDTMGRRIESIERRLPRERVRLTESTKRFHVQIVTKTFRGRCPCCHERDVIVDGRVVGEFDHATETGKATVDHTWLVCRECNQRMSNSRESADRDAFGAYQRHVPRVIQGTLFG